MTLPPARYLQSAPDPHIQNDPVRYSRNLIKHANVAPFLAPHPMIRTFSSIKSSGSLAQTVFLLFALQLSGASYGHGGVAFEDDLCVISIDFMQAHFTVFQPETSDNEEFCEDIPEVTRSVFVMEYLHDLLQEMEIDFRIIRDVEGLGQFARWEDVQAMGDLDPLTVYYEEPRIEPGGFYRSSYDFEEAGSYIGIVTAVHPTEDRFYNSVFYFQVGGADYGTIPLFIFLLILMQLGYWYFNGGYQKWQERRARKRTF